MDKSDELKPHADAEPRPRPDVIVKFRNDVKLPYIDELEKYLVENHLAPWNELAEQFPGITLQRVYITISSDEVQKLEDYAFNDTPSDERPNLLKYFRLVSSPEVDRDKLVEVIRRWEIIELAYVPFEIASPPDLPSTPAVLQALQDQLDLAPSSVGAEEAWLTPNADGRNMQFIDVERGWILNHENFRTNPANPASPSVFIVADPNRSQLSADPDFRSHGASVLGTVAAPDFGGNTIGIAFRASGRVISIDRIPAAGGPAVEDIHDAIIAAANQLTAGDVLLIEAQAKDQNTLKLWPVEVNQLEYQEIRTASNALRVIVEAGGNGAENSAPGTLGNDLDQFTLPGTALHILDRTKPAEFRPDSGAIMVGAATSAAPHTKMAKTADDSQSNFGNRIDCYAWGQNIRTVGGPDPNDYNPTFGGTSGASAMIAGVALVVQGLARANNRGDAPNRTFRPDTLRTLLKNPLYSTPSASQADKIGAMPDLVKIIDKYFGLGPDVYLRDYLGDTGLPHTGPVSASPDIIMRNVPVIAYDTEFGQGSTKQNLDGLGENLVNDGQDKFIYVRISNRGSTPATNVHATVYWSEVSTLLTPNNWHLIGSVVLANPIPSQGMKVGQIVWAQATTPLPPSGHYCFVALVGNDRDPAPSPAQFITWAAYYAFIRQNNNVTWCNFNVTEMHHLHSTAPHLLRFLAHGAQFEDLPMQLEIDAQLPPAAYLWLEGREGFMRALLHADGVDLEDTPDKGIKRLALRTDGRRLFDSVLFPKDLCEPMSLVVDIPPDARQQTYDLSVRQLYQDDEVGRVTWRLVPPGSRNGLTIDDNRQRRLKLASLSGCLMGVLLIMGLGKVMYQFATSSISPLRFRIRHKQR